MVMNVGLLMLAVTACYTITFIQPMILVSLFLIGILRKERHSKLNLIGSIICVIGVVAFQIL